MRSPWTDEGRWFLIGLVVCALISLVAAVAGVWVVVTVVQLITH